MQRTQVSVSCSTFCGMPGHGNGGVGFNDPGVGVMVGVRVTVGVFVFVGVIVGVGVSVGVTVFVGVTVNVGVIVGVAVFVGVAVIVGVGVLAAVTVRMKSGLFPSSFHWSLSSDLKLARILDTPGTAPVVGVNVTLHVEVVAVAVTSVQVKVPGTQVPVIDPAPRENFDVPCGGPQCWLTLMLVTVDVQTVGLPS